MGVLSRYDDSKDDIAPVSAAPLWRYEDSSDEEQSTQIHSSNCGVLFFNAHLSPRSKQPTEDQQL